MKRQMMAAAMIGTFGLATGSAASAGECRQVDANGTACREIAADGLGPHYCLVPEQFGLRGMKSGAATDPWVTEKSIALGGVSISLTGTGLECLNKTSAKLAGASLSIAKSGDRYQATISGKSIDMTPARDADGNMLWLAGTDSNHPNLGYYVFFRDQSGKSVDDPGKTVFPKFLFVEVLDSGESACKDIVPSLEKATVKVGECGPPTHGAVRETGVGGGGEGGKNP